MMAAAPRAAIASWHVAGIESAVGGDAGDFLIEWDLVEKLGQHPSPVRSNRWRLPARHLRRRWW